MSIFKTIANAAAVEQAVLTFYQSWMPTYIAEVERQAGLDAQSLPMIRSFQNRTEFQDWPEEQLPTLIVVSPGFIGEPRQAGDGTYLAPFSIGVASVVSARDKASTNQLAKLYAAAARAAILQHQSVGGIAEGVDWLDERYSDVPEESGRTLASGQAIFRVWIPNAVTAGEGPKEPLEDPYDAPAWPTVATTEVQVDATE